MTRASFISAAAAVSLFYAEGCAQKKTVHTSSARKPIISSNTYMKKPYKAAAAERDPHVRLEPRPKGQYLRWLLVNNGPLSVKPVDRILPVGFWGFIERRGPDGIWRRIPERGGCGTVGASLEVVRPGASVEVTELPPINKRPPLPPGRYRFVVPYMTKPGSKGMDASVFRAVRIFRVERYDRSSARKMLEQLASDSTRACLGSLFGTALAAYVQAAPPSELAALFSLKSKGLDQALDVVHALARLPEFDLMVAGLVDDPGSIHGLAGAVLLAKGGCGSSGRLCGKVAQRLYKAVRGKSLPHEKVIDALGRIPLLWPSGLLDTLVELRVINETGPLVRSLEEAILSAVEHKRYRARLAEIHGRLIRAAVKAGSPSHGRRLVSFAKKLKETKDGIGSLMGNTVGGLGIAGSSGSLDPKCQKLRKGLMGKVRILFRTHGKVCLGPSQVERCLHDRGAKKP